MSDALLISKRTLDTQAASVVRERIIEGAISPGERLTEIKLSEQLGLSRGTVRAALRQLVAEGLVQQVPYTGWEVTRLTASDAWELYTLRSSLEGLAARLVAETISEAGRRALDGALALLEKACRKNDQVTAAKADFALHRTIIQLSGHARLAEQYGIIARQIQRYIVSSDALVANPGALLDQHAPMVDAIKAGDPDRAEQIARAHNLKEGAALVEHLRTHEGKAP